MPSLHYLTVQDIIWINHRVTGKVSPFRYDALEEATFYQYGYGQSTDPAAQAQRFLTGFSKLAPFQEGNEATALVGCLAFLRANGKNASVDNRASGSWIETGGEAPLLKTADGIEIHGQPDIRAIIEEVISEYASFLDIPEKTAA